MRYAIAALLVCLVLGRFGIAATPQPPVQPTDDVPAATGWKMTSVLSGLQHPWGMAFLPDGDVLIAERPGRLRLVHDGQLREEPIAGVPKVLALAQGGLLDVSLHPQFEQNRFVYLTYSSGTADANRTVLARGVLDGDRLGDVRVLFQATPDKAGGIHFGSRILWLPDGTLLLSIGDGGAPPREADRQVSQRLDTHRGKLLRLREDGTVPPDNPFAGSPGALPEIFCYGLRNVQGLAVDAQTGRVWAVDHGPFGGDELNLIVPGANYGWPVATYGADYGSRRRFTPYFTIPGSLDPKVVWVPALAPSGLLLVHGEKFPQWRGNLLAGGLVRQQIRRIILDGDRVVGQEKLVIDHRVRTITQGPDGLIYLLTDEPDGQLIRIEPQ